MSRARARRSRSPTARASARGTRPWSRSTRCSRRRTKTSDASLSRWQRRRAHVHDCRDGHANKEAGALVAPATRAFSTLVQKNSLEQS
eukprot:6177475-Pleurochrysis_carterae.AAC.1